MFFSWPAAAAGAGRIDRSDEFHFRVSRFMVSNNALHRDDGCPRHLKEIMRSIHFSFIAVAGELDR
jgi:hypothetical protein